MNSPQEGVFSVFKQDANSRSTPFYCRWTDEEDKLLFEAVEMHGPHKWSLIAQHIPGRTPVQCSTRWLGALNPHVHKGRWSPEEDEALTIAVQSHLVVDKTEDNLPWSRIAQFIPNRTGIQCQARWTEALDPSVRKGRWKKEEDELLKVGVDRFGCCWIRVASSIPGRTQRQCRTRWNQIQSKQEKARRKQLLLANPTTIEKKKKKRIKNTKKQAVKKEPAVVKIETEATSHFYQQEAIVIPFDITSPFQSPFTASLSEDDTFYDVDDLEIERRDYFMQQQQRQQLQQLQQQECMSLNQDFFTDPPSLLIPSNTFDNLIFDLSKNNFSSIISSA